MGKPFGKHTWLLFMVRVSLHSTEIDFMYTKCDLLLIWIKTYRILPFHQFTAHWVWIDEFLTCGSSTSLTACSTFQIRTGEWYLKNVHLQGDNSFRLCILMNVCKKCVKSLTFRMKHRSDSYFFTFTWKYSRTYFFWCMHFLKIFISHLHWSNVNYMRHWKCQSQRDCYFSWDVFVCAISFFIKICLFWVIASIKAPKAIFIPFLFFSSLQYGKTGERQNRKMNVMRSQQKHLYTWHDFYRHSFIPSEWKGMERVIQPVWWIVFVWPSSSINDKGRW